jgi:actin related protein 2/3 complex subunit 1A/1B
VCPNSAEIHVYRCEPLGEPSRWERVAVLREHDQAVSGLDWAARSGLLLSCAHDRNIYVWTPPVSPGGSWAPALVVHHLTRAALCAAWSPCERKFAVGSGSGALAVCYYEAENNWWVGKLAGKKAHGASVLACAWHPTAPLLATACADGRARVLAAPVRGVDAEQGPEAPRFGDVLLVCEPGAGWVHSVAWAPGGDTLAYVSHAGGVHLVTRLDAARARDWAAAAPPAAAPPLPLDGRLPSLAVTFLSDTLAVAGGFSCSPLLLARGARGWAVAGELAGGEAGGAGGGDKKSAFSERLATFKAQTERGEGGDDAAGAPTGVHQNTITAVRRLPRPAAGIVFSTSGADGRLAVWAADDALAARLGSMSLA